jgi:hypothetical protein
MLVRSNIWSLTEFDNVYMWYELSARGFTGPTSFCPCFPRTNANTFSISQRFRWEYIYIYVLLRQIILTSCQFICEVRLTIKCHLFMAPWLIITGVWIGWLDLLTPCTINLQQNSLTAGDSLHFCSHFTTDLSQSQSYVTTDDQLASLSWHKAPIWGLRPDRHLQACWCGAVSLTKGRGLSFARVTVSSNKSVISMYNLHFTC